MTVFSSPVTCPLPPGPTWLFAPVNRPELIPKAVARADSVILDLEDGAGELDRQSARQVVIDSHLDPETTIVRVVGPDEDGFAGDVEAVKKTDYRFVIVPKLKDRIPEELAGYHVIALIETPQAVVNLSAFASNPDVVALYWGAEDLTGFLGGTHSRIGRDEGWPHNRPGPYRPILNQVRNWTHLTAAAYGKGMIDASKADFSDDQGQYEEAADAARSGFWATAVIHPRQVPVVRRAYQPDPADLEWARRVVAQSSRYPGAFKLDGQMVDAPLIAQAHLIVARADR